MKEYVILADITCDLCQEIRQEIGMEDYITGHIHFEDGRDFSTTLDWEPISREAFYKALSDKKCKITTAPPNIEEYCAAFEKYIQKGMAIISMTLSSKISSTYSCSCVAADRIREKYPEAEITCVDSYRMSGAFGLLVVYAHLLKQEGKSYEEVVAWLEENKYRVHQMGPIDDLIFVARRGRLTMGKAIMGSFAGVKPMGDCNSDGYTTVLTKVKGMSRALDTTVQYVKETATGIENQVILVAHSDREMYANTLKEKLERELSPKRVLLTDVFCGCGANIGPGMVGVYYLGDKVTEDMAVEKAVMNRITGKK
ncbi:MAG: DegV family protein [Clostridia bacterium]|nr:DegV family protein [Clostridia bacterium]